MGKSQKCDQVPWDDTFVIEGVEQTPSEWLEGHYETVTDSEALSILDDAGVPNLGQWSVHGKRNREGWTKGSQEPASIVDSPDVGSSQERFGIKQDGPNEQAAAAQSQYITSIEELVAHSGVDETEWVRVREEARSWTTTMKDEDKDLEFDRGRITGQITSSTGIAQMYYNKVAWVRRKPVEVEPAIRPITTAPLPPPAVIEYKSPTIETSLVIADLHLGFDVPRMRPFHDRRMMATEIAIAKVIQPDRIILIGDSIDLPAWSDYFKIKNEHKGGTQLSLNELHFFLRELRLVAPCARIQLFNGNHDSRLENSFDANLNRSLGLHVVGQQPKYPHNSIPGFIQAEQLGVEWLGKFPGHKEYLNESLRAYHGENYSSTPGGSARATLKNTMVSTIAGHAHRNEQASITYHGRAPGGETVTAYMVGVSCHTDGRVPGKRSEPDWQQGIAVVRYIPDRDFHHVELIQPSAGWIMVDGQPYKGDTEQYMDRLHTYFASEKIDWRPRE